MVKLGDKVTWIDYDEVRRVGTLEDIGTSLMPDVVVRFHGQLTLVERDRLEQPLDLTAIERQWVLRNRMAA